MSTFTKIIRVTPPDLDELNHVNNVRYVQWVQEISKEHWKSQVSEATQQQIIWVVRNHNITYYDSAVLGDVIEMSTEVLNWKGPISVRQVLMRNNKSGKTLVKAITEWCALQAKTMKPVRVPTEIQQLFVRTE